MLICIKAGAGQFGKTGFTENRTVVPADCRCRVMRDEHA